MARHDFIHAKTARPTRRRIPLWDSRSRGEFHGVPVLGSYGPGRLVETPFSWVATCWWPRPAGPNSPSNLVGFREHPNTAYQGLRVIPGHWQDYPLIDAYHQRRLALAIVVQIS